MNATIALLLAQDGLTTGLIYALLTLTILLVFLVTRILWVAAGDFLVMGALTLATLRQGAVPGSVWIVLGFGLAAGLAEAIRALMARSWHGHAGPLLGCVLPAVLMVPLVAWLAPLRPPVVIQIALVVLLIAPLGFSVYRLAFRPLADRSVLMLLFMAVALHFVLVGLDQVVFGSESFRTPAFLPGRLDVHVTRLSYQTMLVFGVSVAAMTALWLFMRYTLWGKALRATALNRLGARLVGVRTESAGALAMVLAVALGALSGVLIGPTTALYFDSGFAIGIKGFVGAVIGGMASFPLALLGAVLIGEVEAFASFFASAYKDSIVYALLIPFLLWRSATARHPEDSES